MGKKQKKIKDERVEFKLSSFFIDKLKFNNNKLSFGTDTRLFEVATLIKKNPKVIAKKLGLELNVDHILDDDQVAEIALIYNLEFEKVDDVSAENVVSEIVNILKTKKHFLHLHHLNVKKRPPVITIMGHVDHGKTTLLDVIRKSNLTAKEVGGITQTIGAYQIKYNDQEMTFIDTPGHEAFTQMRANGSKVTDIAVVVVAADDSIMPQTRESLDHVKAANVPLIIAINKMDAPGANANKVKKDLLKFGVIVEDLGGDVPAIEISALKKQNIDQLLETILLQSELLELKTPDNILGAGTVIESNLDKQKGNLVSVLVQVGTLKQGDTIIIDDFKATVKGMHNDLKQSIPFATPGTPVELYGIGAAPVVGAKFVVVKDLKEADKISAIIHDARLNKLRNNERPSALELFSKLDNNKKQFNLILKANGLGVLEALNKKILEFANDEVEIKIIRQDVGEITNTDLILAEASKASIYNFSQKIPTKLEKEISFKNINIFTFDIIYKLFEDIETKINGLIDDVFEEKKLGTAEVKQLFTFSKLGTIAGCVVREGIIKGNSKVKIIRHKKVIFNGDISSLRIVKDIVKSVRAGQECGILVKDFNKFQEKDIIEAYELIKIN